MSQDIISEINIHKQKLYFKFSDRRSKPFQHVELEIEGTKTQIITRRGERIMQKIILHDKTLEDVNEGLRLIDCPKSC